VNESIENPPRGGESLGPGSRLRLEREKRGLSTIEAAERLHLDSWVVESLEANRFDPVGPPVFAKGHLRRYALLLGLPAAEIVSAYEAWRQDTSHRPAPPVAAAPPIPQAAPVMPKQVVRIGTALISVAILAGILIARKPWRPLPAPVSAAVSGAASSADVTPAPEGDVPAAETSNASGAAQSQAASTANTEGAGRARLRMSFSADSWVEIRDAGGATLFRGKGAANSVKVVSGLAPLTIYLGYVSGVQLEVNSHAVAIGPQFVHGDVARFDAGADGVLRRSPRT
jgi:cytoskeleton protein RodZ